MAKTRNATSPLPYIQHLLEDEYVQEQLANAGAAARDAYARAARKRGQAAEDKKLYAQLRHAATSLRNAGAALRRAPEPPPKRRGRNLLIISLGIGATVLIVKFVQRPVNAAPADGGSSSVDHSRTDAAPAQPASAPS